MKRLMVAGVAVATLLLTGCSGSAGGNNSGGSGEAIKIAWISPDATSSSRWETKDLPAFRAEVKRLVPDATILASTAGTDAVMLQQAESAVSQGVNVIVINPITSDGALPVVKLAKQNKIPVIAYEGLIANAELAGYITFNNEKVGELQAQYIVDHAGSDPTVAIMNGAQVCAACIAFKQGAHKIFDPLKASGKLTIGYEADTPDWLTANAQKQTEQALTKLGDKVNAVYAANDGLATGVIAALKARKLNGKVIVTGQDATTPGLQSILLGDQTMTVYKDFNLQAKAGAKAAVDAAEGKKDPQLDSIYDNGGHKVPALFLTPSVIDKSNIKKVVDDGFITRDELCSGNAKNACTF